MFKSNTFPILLLIACIFCSCSTTKKDLAFFQDLADSNSGTLPTIPYTNTVEPESELVITVNADNPEVVADFNLPYLNPTTPRSLSSNPQPRQQTYMVDKDGYIDFPKLGKIHVAGMTTYQIKDYLTKRISEYVKNPIVNVTLNSYRIVVMGEVNNPNTFFVSNDRFSVLDALAEAGGLSDYALRDNILVLRRNDKNQIEYTRLNLHNSNITQSPCFWLKNNDVVLVSPNQIKEENSKYNTNNAYKLSVISTIVGMSSAIISLIIALAVK
ncbi:MAG: polysaccharide export protein [Firmicutes bacterium]|nr:polysaccharide export protein [Bacillota bacterium]MCM1401233.1 polysaccharide export protein [Bacteroides sp.]MCM1477218.1 polysaccharide export protein [Bacteroides sp.]